MSSKTATWNFQPLVLCRLTWTFQSKGKEGRKLLNTSAMNG